MASSMQMLLSFLLFLVAFTSAEYVNVEYYGDFTNKFVNTSTCTSEGLCSRVSYEEGKCSENYIAPKFGATSKLYMILTNNNGDLVVKSYNDSTCEHEYICDQCAGTYKLDGSCDMLTADGLEYTWKASVSATALYPTNGLFACSSKYVNTKYYGDFVGRTNTDTCTDINKCKAFSFAIGKCTRNGIAALFNTTQWIFLTQVGDKYMWQSYTDANCENKLVCNQCSGTFESSTCTVLKEPMDFTYELTSVGKALYSTGIIAESCKQYTTPAPGETTAPVKYINMQYFGDFVTFKNTTGCSDLKTCKQVSWEVGKCEYNGISALFSSTPQYLVVAQSSGGSLRWQSYIDASCSIKLECDQCTGSFEETCTELKIPMTFSYVSSVADTAKYTTIAEDCSSLQPTESPDSASFISLMSPLLILVLSFAIFL
eukprot:m.337095 g.337095  ORF g.337095 m.337095 type:complete len:428 (+) comp18044_c0_seq1:15-1298(+)